MQFMILMIPAVYRGNQPGPSKFDTKAMERMGQFNERLAQHVEILSLNGLHPLTKGARLSFAQGKPTVIDGAAVRTTEVLGGYWLVDAPSQDKLVELMKDCPAEEGDLIEIRQVFTEADFAAQQ